MSNNNKPTQRPTPTQSGKPSPAPSQKQEETKLTPEEKKAANAARFKKIASGRATAIVKNLSLLENCSNKNVYEYTQEQIDRMFSSIDKALARAKDKYVQKQAEAKVDKVEL